MTENQITEIKVNREALHSKGCECGGAYRSVSVEICVDSEADPYTQRTALVHEILGAYLGSIVPVETLSEIAESIVDSLDGN